MRTVRVVLLSYSLSLYPVLSATIAAVKKNGLKFSVFFLQSLPFNIGYENVY